MPPTVEAGSYHPHNPMNPFILIILIQTIIWGPMARVNPPITGAKGWTDSPIESVYIPVKEMLANAIAETFADLYDREVRRSLGDLVQ